MFYEKLVAQLRGIYTAIAENRTCFVVHFSGLQREVKRKLLVARTRVPPGLVLAWCLMQESTPQAISSRHLSLFLSFVICKRQLQRRGSDGLAQEGPHAAKR